MKKQIVRLLKMSLNAYILAYQPKIVLNTEKYDTKNSIIIFLINTRNYTLLIGNESIFITSYLYFFQVIKWTKVSEYINK